MKFDRVQNILVILYLGDVCGLNNLLFLLFKGKWLRFYPNLSELESTTNFDKGFKIKNWSVNPLPYPALCLVLWDLHRWLCGVRYINYQSFYLDQETFELHRATLGSATLQLATAVYGWEYS